jgi:carboxypeptidase PM20D1
MLAAMRILVRLFLALLAAAAVLVAVLVVNAWRQGSRQLDVPAVSTPPVDVAGAAERLAAAVRIRTVSFDDPAEPRAADSARAFAELHALLERSYPRVHATLERESVGGLSLLYTWRGADPSLPPVLLMAHQDVVPIAPGTEQSWTVEPFSGERRDGFVWGRGAWDDKGNLVAILEAVESLLARGAQPRRTVLLAFGHDEEIGGERGAKQIAALLASRGTKPEFVVDEGLLITEGVLAGLDKPLALVGVAEKGILNVTVSARAVPGHSSQPGRETAIGTLARALARLEDRQMPAAIRGVAAGTFAAIAPEMSGLNRVLLSNLWLTAPLVQRQLERGAASNALLRTTTALTVVKGGEKSNVLPGLAEANVNFRLLPGDTADAVVDHVRRAVDDERVKVERAPGMGPVEASPVSPSDASGYRLIERTVRELFPGTVVAPGLMIGATDSRHFAALTDQIYRFSPVRARTEDLPRFHGTNERISEANLGELVAFYVRLLDNAAIAAR